MIAFLMLAAAALPPTERLKCNLTTVYEGETKRSVRSVLLAPNSWQEAELGRPFAELCSRPGAGGYRCSLIGRSFTATSQAAGPEPSLVHIDLYSGSYTDRGYMDGKPLVTRGICKRL
jgi:hypothetical protein